jgi:hypothetical protein
MTFTPGCLVSQAGIHRLLDQGRTQEPLLPSPAPMKISAPLSMTGAGAILIVVGATSVALTLPVAMASRPSPCESDIEEDSQAAVKSPSKAATVRSLAPSESLDLVFWMVLMTRVSFSTMS